jgi:Phosphotransferase enzyme family
MELFQPNNLSRVRPEFTALNDSVLKDLVASLLREHYSLHETSSLQLARYVGPNVASQNLRLELGDEIYFLKSRTADKRDALAAEAKLASRLVEIGIKAPQVKRTVKGDLVSVHGGSCWAVYIFEDGEYFNGRGSELDEAAKTFAELTKAASRLFSESPPLSVGGEESFLEGLAPLLDQGIAGSTTEVKNLCQAHRSTILGHLRQAKAKRSLESHSLTLHLDYHPLNLIMRNGEVGCVLDLEHLKRYPTSAGLGFAAYKLIRQAMVDAGIRAREQSRPSLVGRWLEPWHRTFPQPRYNATELGWGASYRVLALIYLILSASLQRGDDRSNYDLAKQIGSLYEIDVIFGGR